MDQFSMNTISTSISTHIMNQYSIDKHSSYTDIYLFTNYVPPLSINTVPTNTSMYKYYELTTRH